MSQKFISLDDAAAKLGVSKDKLNELREAGDLRAYRDGASWKFRTEEIDKLEAEGLPGGGGDLGLSDDDDLMLSPGSDAPLAADDDDIGLGVEPLGDGDDAESILLTGDQEPDGGVPRPQSTIIGKSELSLEDDLKLAGDSDAPLAASAEPPAPAAASDFDDLELDLDDGSDDAIDAPKAAEPTEVSAAASDLELDDLELDLAGSDVSAASGEDVLAGEGARSGADLSGSIAGISGIDSIELSDDEDDDLVLGGSGDDLGSGIPGSDSGINLAPSDSGFALDEVPLDLGGSNIGSALDLASLSAASQIGSSTGSKVGSSAVGGDFQLTPDDPSEEDEDSSQIVALEDVSEEDELDEDMPGFEPDDDAGNDFAGGFEDAEAAAPARATAGAVQETPFPAWVIGLLSCGFFGMLLAGIMAMDLLQSMWAWDEPYAFSSSVMDGLLSLVGG